MPELETEEEMESDEEAGEAVVVTGSIEDDVANADEVVVADIVDSDVDDDVSEDVWGTIGVEKSGCVGNSAYLGGR